MDVTGRIEIGSNLTRTITVTDEMTVGYSVPGMPMVFATPQMIHHMEVACAALVAEVLPSGWVSVGTHVNVDHVAATPVGMLVTTRVTVAEVDGRTVTFDVNASDEAGTIGSGCHRRGLVETARFLAGTRRKLAAAR